MAELGFCPTRDELQQMVLGQLAAADADRILQHLDECPHCVANLRQAVASDDFLALVRASRPSSCTPTRTMDVPIPSIPALTATRVQADDSTVCDPPDARSVSAEIKRLLSPPQSSDEIGRFADFRILRLLGAGGMGLVFEAEDIQLKRRVALKLMHPEIAVKPGATERFLREAQSAAALKHDHIVTLYQVGTHAGTWFLALELLHGQTLENYLESHPRLSAGEVRRIGREIACGLAAAHARGLIHRDIKPANIWLERPASSSSEPKVANANLASDRPPIPATFAQPTAQLPSAGKVKILDFGLAKPWTTDAEITHSGVVIGTPHYMAPERMAGGSVDSRIDLFSLGCLMYRMATGKLPFGGNDLVSVVRSLVVDEPAPARQLNPEIPQALSDLIAQLLSKSPDKRTASADAVVERLKTIEAGLAAEARRELLEQGLSTSAGAPRESRWRLWAAWSAIALLLFAPVGIYLFSGRKVIDVPPGVKPKLKAQATPQVRAPVRSSGSQGSVSGATSADLNRRAAAWVLAKGGSANLRIIREVKPIALEAGKPLPGKAFVLTTVHLLGTTLPDTELSHLQGLQDLVDLSLSGKLITDSGLARLAGLTGLKTLVFYRTSISDAGVLQLRNLLKLEHLALTGGRVSDAGLSRLKGLKNLRSLVLDGTLVTNAGLAQLKNFPQLEVLVLNGTHVTNTGLSVLKESEKLRSLSLNATAISDAGLAQLGALKPLEYLDLGGTHVTDAGLVHLRSLVRLRSLNLEKTSVSDAGLSQLKTLPRLEALYLGATRVTDAGLSQLPAARMLRSLNLKGATRVDDGAIPTLLRAPQLTLIDLTDTRVSAKGFAALKGALPGSVRLVWSESNNTAACAVLAAGGSVEVRLESGPKTLLRAGDALPASNFRVTQACLAGVRKPLAPVLSALKNPGLTSLISIDLSNTTIGDADLLLLKANTGLQRLILSGTAIHGAGLEHLREMSSLDELALGGTQVTDAALICLHGFAKLHTLLLDGTRVTDAGLVYIEPLKHLRQLSLERTGVTNAGLVHLARLTELRTLILKKTAVSDAGLATLHGLKNLETLSLSGTGVSDAGLAQLDGFKNLRALLLEGTHLTDDGLGRLGNLPQLDVLSLDRTAVTDAGTPRLKALTQLRSLSLNVTRITDVSLAAFESLTRLQKLGLNYTRVTDAGLEHLRLLKNLRVLLLEHTGVSDAGMEQLEHISLLEGLYLGQTLVTDAGLARLEALQSLHELSLKGSGQIRDGAIPKILRLEKLTTIDVSDTEISAKGYGILKGAFAGSTHISWSEPNYAAANAVLLVGGSVEVRLDGESDSRSVKSLGALPHGSFRITEASLVGVRKPLAGVLAKLKDCKLAAFAGLDLSRAAIVDADLRQLKGLAHLEDLGLADTSITDAGLVQLKGLTSLRRLTLDGTAISGPGLMYLQQLPELEELRLGCPSLSDAFLPELAVFKRLERLSFAKSLLSDEGAHSLSSLVQLKELDLTETKVSAAAIAKLKKSLPHCQIITGAVAP